MFEIFAFLIFVATIAATYAIGFGIGRRSAYRDLEQNIGKPKQASARKRVVKAKGALVAHLIK